ncbi:36511_t:CDS:2 [Gigaspora margarita]|uniref:36511_t:CDS:1 n=1 Tax=Gigaspora margarita TaxID=4874 RepID=A0ABN7V103_GIGMA|nr:36511_t:CDS:2 [Gigaspora margarita]
MSLKIAKKIAPNNQPKLCCPTNHSVYICGVDSTLMNISGNMLKDLVAPIVDYKKIHVLKKKTFNYGHLHFETKKDAEKFYITSKGQIFTIKDKRFGTIEVYFKEPTHYDNNSGDSDNGEGTSYSTNVPNSTITTRVVQSFTKAKSKDTGKQRLCETTSSSSNVSKLKRNNTDSLIEFLTNDEEFTNMNIDKSFFNKLQEEEVTNNSFIRLRKDDLKECGLKIGPSLEVEDYLNRLELHNGNLRKRQFDDIN